MRIGVIGFLKAYLPFVTATLAITAPWFFAPGFLFLTDLSWGPLVPLEWRLPTFFPNLIIVGLNTFLPLPLVQKLFVSGAFLTAVMGGRSVARQFLSGNFAIFAVSLFALFNPFVYDRAGYGQFGIIYAFGFLCLTAASLIGFSRGREPRGMAFAGLWSGLAIMFSPHFLFFSGAFYALAINVSLTRGESLRRVAAGALLAGVLAFGVNANWLVPALAGSSVVAETVGTRITREHLVAFQTSGETGLGALLNVVMLSGFWGKDQLRYVDLSRLGGLWGKAFMLLAPLMLYGAIRALRGSDRGERRLAIGLLVLIVSGWILAVGIRLPVARELTHWLFDHLPLYKGNRETQKWVSVVAVGYTVFLALGVREFLKLSLVRAHREVITGLLAAVIVMQAPTLLWGMGGQVRPVNFPPDWAETDRLLVQDDCPGTVLFLPWHQYLSFAWTDTVVYNPAKFFFRCPILQGKNMEWAGIYDSSNAPEGIAVTRWVLKEGQTELFLDHRLGLTHIILAKGADWERYAWLDTDPGLEPVFEGPYIKLFKIRQ